ncbi:MAG: hypothetical protein QXH58_04595 [Nitrososphaerales archaeon]
MSAKRREIYARVSASSINFRKILSEIETAIERLEVLGYEVKKELEKCVAIGV